MRVTSADMAIMDIKGRNHDLNVVVMVDILDRYSLIGFPNSYRSNTVKEAVKSLNMVSMPGYKYDDAHIGYTVYVLEENLNKY